MRRTAAPGPKPKWLNVCFCAAVGGQSEIKRASPGFRILTVHDLIRNLDSKLKFNGAPPQATYGVAWNCLGMRAIHANRMEEALATTIKINGLDRTVDVDGDTPLLWVLRDVLGMTGTKFGCGVAICGACTVHLDGAPRRSCVTPIGSIGNKAITTIEAVGKTAQGRALQKAWLDLEGVQCGYCQSGQIMSAAALLTAMAKPSDAHI